MAETTDHDHQARWSTKSQGGNVGLGLLFGALVGVVIGAAIDNIPLGIAIGIPLGMALGISSGFVRRVRPKQPDSTED